MRRHIKDIGKTTFPAQSVGGTDPPHESTNPMHPHSEASSGIGDSAQRFAPYVLYALALGFNTLCYDAAGELIFRTNNSFFRCRRGNCRYYYKNTIYCRAIDVTCAYVRTLIFFEADLKSAKTDRQNRFFAEQGAGYTHLQKFYRRLV